MYKITLVFNEEERQEDGTKIGLSSAIMPHLGDMIRFNAQRDKWYRVTRIEWRLEGESGNIQLYLEKEKRCATYGKNH